MEADPTGPGRSAALVGRAIVALRLLIVAAWAAAAVAAVIHLPTLGGAGSDLPLPDDAPSLAAERRSAEIFGAPLIARTQAVVGRPEGLAPTEQVDLGQFALAVTRRQVPGLEEIAAAVPLTSAGGVAPGARPGPASVLTYLAMGDDLSIPRQVALGEAYLATAPVPPGARAGLTGSVPVRDQQLGTIDERLPWVVAVTLALIALTVGLVFGSPVAPLVVLGTIGLAYVIDLRLIGWVGEREGIAANADIEPVISALLIGIVTDYAIFYLFAMRRGLRAGVDAREAARGAGARMAAIVATAGLITALGTATLLVGDVDFFRAFGPALAITALTGVAVSITLLPAMLALLGRATFWPRGPGAEEAARPATRRAPVATRVLTTRAGAAVAALALLAGLAAAATPLRDLELGLGLASALSSDARAADAGFAPGVTAPTEVLVEGPGAADPAVLARLGDALAARPGVADVVGPGDVVGVAATSAFVSGDAGAGRLVVILASEPTEHAAIADLDAIRAGLPGMLADAGAPGARASLAGDTAIASESVEAIGDELARVGLAALAVNLLLLALFLRAAVAPVYLLAANALTVAATLGIATWFFQDLLGQGQLAYYVPFAATVLLLALGSDYNVFMVGDIWRAARETGVAEGIRTAAPAVSRAISVAGLILAGSFALLALVPVDALRQFAFVMAVGALLDAFVVRPLLVPALITVFGRAGSWPSAALGGPQGYHRRG